MVTPHKRPRGPVLTARLDARPTRTNEADLPMNIGRFFILRRLGSGGMSQVLLGYDEDLDRKLAIKLLHPRGAPHLRDRMVREAQALAQLSHPNVVQVYEVGEYRGSLYLAMEFIQGVTLHKWVKDRRLDEILEIYLQAGRGLAAAHRAGLFHRDFKPANAMIGRDGRVRVMDFGLVRGEADARDTEEHTAVRAVDTPLWAEMTQDGIAAGTPAYMAPEQWSGAPVDGRTDQFAFCLSLWEAFYGERPFSGREMRIIREQVLTGDRVPPPPGSRVPAWLRKVLERGLSTDPAQRWPSMDDLLAALASHRTRRRRTFIGAGAVAFAVAVVATVGAGRWSAARQAAACAAAGESIHEVWNDEVRQRPAAAAAPFIDRFAERWQAARSAACTRGLADPGWSPELAARAEECLQDARVQLESSLAVLAGDDPAAARNAVEVVADMPELGPCLDAPHLARRPGLPAGDAALALRRELAEVRARHAAGVHHDALARVQDLLPRVDALDWAPLTVQSRMLAAAVAEDPRQVEAWLLEALVGATRGGDMTTAGDAAAALAEVVGSRLADHEEGLRWGRLAYALVVAQGDAESLRAARMLHPLADNYLGVGDHEGAENLYRRALELWQRLAPDHPGHARTQVRLADLHRLRGRLDRAAEMYGQALELRLRVLGSEHPDVAAALASLAAVAFEAGDLDAAELRHAEALALRERVLGPQHPDVARSLAELAAVHGARSRFDAAEQLLERSLEILEQALGPDHLDLTATLLRLAEVLERRGEHARAVAAYARSLAIGEKARGRDHLDNARPLLGLGLVELARGRSAEAVRHLDRARLLFARGGQAVEAARAQIALAQALWARRGARPRARELAEQARTTLCSAGVPGPCYAARTWLAEHV